MYYGLGFILYCIICGIISKSINESKGYTNGFAWGAWFGIIGIIVVLCKRNISEKTEPPQTETKPLEVLEHLSELHKKGVLTDEEFELKKAELLRKI